MVLLGLDVETGGLPSVDFRPSLLTLYMSVYDENFKILDEIDLKVKPNPDKQNRSNYIIQAEGLDINKIDIIQHDKEAITYNESKTIIYDWLNNISQKYERPIPFGNNVGFDIMYIQEHTVSKNSWDNLVSNVYIDLRQISKYLQLSGVIPKDQSFSLSKIAQFFNIYVDDSLLHTAKYDVQLGAELLKHYINFLKKEVVFHTNELE